MADRVQRHDGVHAGGIVALADLIDEHRAAFEYDWRTRFHLPVKVVGRSMTWGEAWRLTRVLAGDPSSQIAASVGEWDYPISREAMALMDTFDLHHQIAWGKGGKKGPRPKPYPRPWPDKKKSRPRPSVSPAVAIAALRAAGHTAALPKQFQHLEVSGGASHG